MMIDLVQVQVQKRRKIKIAKVEVTKKRVMMKEVINHRKMMKVTKKKRRVRVRVRVRVVVILIKVLLARKASSTQLTMMRWERKK